MDFVTPCSSNPDSYTGTTDPTLGCNQWGTLEALYIFIHLLIYLVVFVHSLGNLHHGELYHHIPN